MNKKAVSKFGVITSLVLMGLLIVILAGPALRDGVLAGSQGLAGMVKGIFTKSSGETPDIMNPCQCGWPSPDGYEQIEHEGALLCVYSRTNCNSKLDTRIYKQIEYKQIEAADPVTLCVYAQSDCLEYK